MAKRYVSNWKRFKMRSAWYRPPAISALKAGTFSAADQAGEYGRWLACRDRIRSDGMEEAIRWHGREFVDTYFHDRLSSYDYLSRRKAA